MSKKDECIITFCLIYVLQNGHSWDWVFNSGHFNLSILVANYTVDTVCPIHLFPRMQNMSHFNSDFRELKLYA